MKKTLLAVVLAASAMSAHAFVAVVAAHPVPVAVAAVHPVIAAHPVYVAPHVAVIEHPAPLPVVVVHPSHVVRHCDAYGRCVDVVH